MFIGYGAELRWRALSLAYASTLERRSSEIRNAFSITGARMPEPRDGRIVWNCPALQIEAQWESDQPGVRETIFSNADGAIEWRCLQPRSDASIRLGNASLCGQGYIEQLHMTLVPWRLPIDELRWGHLVTSRDAIVWIQWIGKFGVEIVYENGRRVQASRIGDDSVVLEGGTSLEFDRGCVLRSGELGSTVLAGIPRLAKMLPGRILGVTECKWLSRATLRRRGGPDETGWAIHEVVRWP